MLQKLLAVGLAFTMLMGMTISSSAVKVIKKKAASATSPAVTAEATKQAQKKTAGTASYDFCPSQLDGLAETIHDELVKGLRAQQDTIEVNISGYSSAQVQEAFQQAVQMIIEQHAEIFWLDPHMQNFVSNAKTLIFYPRPSSAYGTANTDGTAASKLDMNGIRSTDAKLQKFASKITGTTPYELTKNIHDAIIANSTYYVGEDNKASYHEATGALIYGIGLCDSYAKAFKYLADCKGLEALVVGGNASNALGQTGTHAWNYVKLEDGKWYPVDTGWDDPVVEGQKDNAKYNYIYFLKSVPNDKRQKDGYAYPKLSATDYKAA